MFPAGLGLAGEIGQQASNHLGSAGPMRIRQKRTARLREATRCCQAQRLRLTLGAPEGPSVRQPELEGSSDSGKERQPSQVRDSVLPPSVTKTSP